jgi:hypothetical protein
MIVWGIISGATAACQNFAGLVACRFFLGFVEAAYFVGGHLSPFLDRLLILLARVSLLPLLMVYPKRTWFPYCYPVFWIIDFWCIRRLDYCWYHWKHGRRKGPEGMVSTCLFHILLTNVLILI